MTELSTTCCIAGGGPAGMMLGLLLARAGVEVIVLEKHKDFLRDFRGDTVHPSTMQIMDELGYLDKFLKRPHQKIRTINGLFGETLVTIADFAHLPTRAKFIALMPQWEFLNFLVDEAQKLPTFKVMMEAKATDLIRENGRVTGIIVETPNGQVAIKADLAVGADGRHSTLREKANMKVRDIGAPIDVLWFRIPKITENPQQTLGMFNSGRVLVTLDRGDYWQCAYVITKGGFNEMRTRDIQSLRDEVSRIAPFLTPAMKDLQGWNDVKLLTVTIDRLEQWWQPGLICIGDAAHAMSPIGGVGINLAIQDAVAAANILTLPLLTHTLDDRELNAVQVRRTFPVAVIQAVQLFIQNQLIIPTLSQSAPTKAPLIVLLLKKFPVLQWIPARILGMGVRPEHVRM